MLGSKPFLFQEAPDFPLVLGGPLFQLFRRSRLSGTGLELSYRRILLIPLVAWLPLLLLSLLGSHLPGTTVKLTFLRDIERPIAGGIASADSRRIGYDLLANRYVEGFEEKWVKGNAAEHEDLLGSGDIQSLADLANSYAVVREMRPVPFDLKDITRLTVATASTSTFGTHSIFS